MPLKKGDYTVHMTQNESAQPKKKPKIWQIVIVALLALLVIGQFTGGSDSTESQNSGSPQVTTAEEPSVDIFTKRACRKFREFAAEGGKGVLTIPEMREQFRVSYEAAQFSEIPAIVSSATRTMAALTSEDVEEFSSASMALGEACLAAGQ
jgi:hypothetical protein